MFCIQNQFLEQWDRTFLDLSSKMTEPLCSAWHLLAFRLVSPLGPQKFENCTTLTKEIATRILIGCTAVVTACIVRKKIQLSFIGILGWAVASKVARYIGFALQRDGYTHVKGIALEKIVDAKDPQIKVMNWNICGVGGGLSLNHGGVTHWRLRLDQILEEIKKQDPDVLVLQEIYDTALAEALIERLQSDYAHFFVHLGPNVWGSVGGCMMISKCAVHDFSHTSFTNNSWSLNRGFGTLELKATPLDKTPFIRIIGTHLIHGDEEIDRENRRDQVTQIVDSIFKKSIVLPTILAGDLNIERDQEEGSFLSSYFDHAYLDQNPTCTNRLVSQWDLKQRTVLDETIDYISYFKRTLFREPFLPLVDDNFILADCHLVKAFDESYNTKTALSDHHGLVVVLKKLCNG